MDPEYERIARDPVLETNGKKKRRTHIRVPAAAKEWGNPMQPETKKKQAAQARPHAC
jgi:hypothetical protein